MDKLTVPEEIPAGETVLVLEIFKPSGSTVAQGDIIFELETSKTSYEIFATNGGLLNHTLSLGDQVASGDVIATIIPRSS